MTRHAFRCALGVPVAGRLPANAIVASSVTSPDTFFQTYRKWSAAAHMFSPPPDTV